MLLGFTKDPFPHVRASALEGLVGFCERGGESKDVGLVDACYRRAVRLLRDVDPSVRFSAVRVVRFRVTTLTLFFSFLSLTLTFDFILSLNLIK